MNRKLHRTPGKSHPRAAGSFKPQAKFPEPGTHARIAGVRSDQNTIGLCMIVKNESPVILRCLESVRPLVDYVLIEDTGSTDGTQKIVRDWLDRTGIPGEVIEEPWQNFAYNRSHVLARLRERKDIDYALVIDADDTLVLPAGFALPPLDADTYILEIRHHELRYFRPHLLRNALAWRYEGVIHEFLSVPGIDGHARRLPEEMRQKVLSGLHYLMHDDGARRRTDDKTRYARDAAVIAHALEDEHDPLLRARYTFYLGQSYQNADQPERAIEAYRRRATMGFWDQEVFVSLYRAAQIMAQRVGQTGYDLEPVIAAYQAASAACPARAEALHGASRLCRINKKFADGYNFARDGLKIPKPSNGLFVDSWVYEYGLLDELAVNAYWSGQYKDCLDACHRLLREGNMPGHMRERIEKNADFAREILRHGSQSAISEEAPAPPPAVAPKSDGRIADKTTDIQEDPSSTGQISPEPSSLNGSIRHIPNTLHVIGVAHTVPHEDYLVCAFTAKILLFPGMIQPFGWHVIEYSNEGSASEANEHIVILTQERLRTLSRRGSRDEPLDADANNTELRQEFQSILKEKIRSRARPGDIICHVWGPDMEVYNLLPDCRHIELSVGYTASPGLPFRIYESSAWMHWHYGKAGQEDGNHYKWVIPSPFDADKWAFREEPDDYAIFLGRITPRKGMNELVEIARRMPDLPIHAYGPGDPSRWAMTGPPNLTFKGPIFGDERIDVVGRARCMLMPTVFIEPFGFSGIEAQLCGVPLIAPSYGAFQETILEGVTGYRCHTLADWVEAVRLSSSLDRRRIADTARSRYSKEVIGRQYDWALRQLADLSGRGWYGEQSRKFPGITTAPAVRTAGSRNPRIWLFMPYYGQFPNYFQLYLDSLARNADLLSVFLLTDGNLGNYRVPENIIRISMSLDQLRERCALFLAKEYGLTVKSESLIKGPYKLCDFRVTYLKLFDDIAKQYGVTEDDYVGWGDCDLIYGRLADFLDLSVRYDVIGGFHGHLTALRNTETAQNMFRSIDHLPEMLLDDNSHVVDEIAFRRQINELRDRDPRAMFYMNSYFCDIVPELFFGRFRPDYSTRQKNFFDAYHSDKDITHVFCDQDGRLTVLYDDGESRRSIYCHLQKRAMKLEDGQFEKGYFVRENAFEPVGFVRDGQLDPALVTYLAEPGPYCLEVGAGWNTRPGWLATDLNPPADLACMKLDATKSFGIPSESFDFVYSEHMIEHISFQEGLNMLEECNRILKPGGTIRIVTPSIGFLTRVISSDRGLLEDRYKIWSVETFIPGAPAITNAFFLNNFVRQWGHTFIYDRETLELALRLSGFEQIVVCELNDSAHFLLRGLANVGKMPDGFLGLESMVLEGTKPPSATRALPSGRNLSIGRRATQSSVCKWSREGSPEADAARVVSGHFTGSFNCHTDFDLPAWWRVDLAGVRHISEVHIYNRVSSGPAIAGRANRFELMVSDDDQIWKTVFRKDNNNPLRGMTRNGPFIWKPKEPVPGRYIRIQLLERQYLHLDQVEIFGA